MPTPNIYSSAVADPFAEVPPELQHNRVEVLYLTDRRAEGTPPSSPKYGYKRSRSVAFGVSEVELGEGVSWEKLVAASRTRDRERDLPVRVVKTTELIRFPETPRILAELPPLQPPSTHPTPTATTLKAELEAEIQQAHAELSARLAKTPTKEVFIFVHGYANSFDSAVMTIAQVWHFLGRRGVPIAYTWPAGGKGLLRGYTYDRESSEFTVYHLKEMIRAIAKCEDVEKINIICHSRGTGVVVSSLAELHMEIGGSGRSTREVLKLGTLVLAAPDIDLDVMIQRAVTVRLGLVPENTVIYVCAKDKALSLSNWLFRGATRLGAIRSDMFTADELRMIRTNETVQIIDCRISDPGPYGHSYFHSNPAVSSDLILLMRYGAAVGPDRPLRSADGTFWIVDDDYPGPEARPEAAKSAR